MKVHCRRYAIASRHCTLVERAKCLHCRRHARDGLYQLCVSANCQTAFGRNSYAIDGTVAGVIGDVYSGSERIRGIETRQQSEFFFCKLFSSRCTALICTTTTGSFAKSDELWTRTVALVVVALVVTAATA